MASSSRSREYGALPRPSDSSSRPSLDQDEPQHPHEAVALLSGTASPVSDDGSRGILGGRSRHDHLEGSDDGPDTTERQARQAMAAEHALTPWQAIKMYPMAIFWSLMVSMCVIMEGMLCLSLRSRRLADQPQATMPSSSATSSPTPPLRKNTANTSTTRDSISSLRCGRLL